MADSFKYTPEEDAAIDREMRQYLKDAKFFKDRDDKAALEQSARDNAAAENEALGMVRVREHHLRAERPVVRKKYEGPDPDRANRGNFVSKEELADFQRKYGADKTLRDLLNADQGLTRRGSSPLSTEAMRSRGVQGANIAPEQPTLRSLLGITAPKDKKDPLQRIGNLPPSKSPEEERDEAKNRTLAALTLMGGLGTNLAGRAIAARMAAPASRAPASQGPLVRDGHLIPDFKKGGKVKAYAKGGSVKGSGCEQRGLRKCKIY